LITDDGNINLSGYANEIDDIEELENRLKDYFFYVM
jgi:hypothetical protein